MRKLPHLVKQDEYPEISSLFLDGVICRKEVSNNIVYYSTNS